MILRKFQLSDYEEVVDMYYSFISDVYPKRDKGSKYFFYRAVMEWISGGKNIIVVEDSGNICGFSLAYNNDMGGITESVYFVEVIYLKKEYRNTKAAYIMYHNISEYAKENNLTISGMASVNTVGSRIIENHFDGDKMFINFERKAT